MTPGSAARVLWLFIEPSGCRDSDRDSDRGACPALPSAMFRLPAVRRALARASGACGKCMWVLGLLQGTYGCFVWGFI